MADEFLATTLAWVLQELSSVEVDAEDLAAGVTARVADQLRCASALRSGRLSGVAAAAPTSREARHLAREGKPWAQVSRIATEFLRAEHDLDWLATEVLLPDPELAGRLFHLAVLGVVLVACRDAGCSIASVSPLYGGHGGPHYSIQDRSGNPWELWFEAGGIWRANRSRSPYELVSRTLASGSRPLAADLLIRPTEGEGGFAIECKHSTNPDYVRSGLVEALAYGNELEPLLGSPTNVRVVSPLGGGFAAFPERVGTGDANALDPEQLYVEFFTLFASR